jgi:hypothetical protein
MHVWHGQATGRCQDEKQLIYSVGSRGGFVRPNIQQEHLPKLGPSQPASQLSTSPSVSWFMSTQALNSSIMSGAQRQYCIWIE